MEQIKYIKIQEFVIKLGKNYQYSLDMVNAPTHYFKIW